MHKTNWKNILKMPVPLNTEQTRDTDYTQAITEYEEKVIEPQITAQLQEQRAGQNSEFTITGGDSKEDFMMNRSLGYAIGYDMLKELGSNLNFILKVIADIYKNEGWEISWPDGMNGKRIVMSQNAE